MAFNCPHCGRPGISFVDKLFTSASDWSRRASICRYCRKAGRLPGQAVQLQFLLFVIALAVIAWIVPVEYRIIAALIVATIIVSIGILAPLKRQLI